jgi:hypothetical protein
VLVTTLLEQLGLNLKRSMPTVKDLVAKYALQVRV